MTNTLYIDLETYSPIDLKKCGVYKYSEKVEILLFAYALNDTPVQVWDCTENKKIPGVLRGHVVDKSHYLCAQNSGFDRVVLEHCWSEFVNGSIWRDTMVRALAHGLPGGLMALSEIFKLPIDKAKDKSGHTLIHLFCKPQKNGSRATRFTHPKEWEEFKNYAGLDIEAMRILDKKLPVWNDTEEERALWYLDQKINDRGFAVDSELAQAAIRAVEKERIIRNASTLDATDGAVQAATQRDALLKYILEIHGVDLPDMQIGTLTRRLEDPDLPKPVKELIQLRLESSGTSTKKYSTLLSSVCSDGRLRGGLQFCGASRTGRYSGRIFQPQNLPRPKFKKDDIEIGIAALKADCANLLYENVTKFASSALRGVITAPKGRKLVVSDLSGIEGRMLAWLAGEEWKVKAYYDFDAGKIENDMYELTYAKTFNIDPSDVDKDQRKLGKVLELAMGYGGGVGAFVTFASGYGVDLEALASGVWGELPERVLDDASGYWECCVKDHKTLGLSEKVFVACDSLKRLWREANPKIVQFWADLQDAVYQALLFDRVVTGTHFKVDKKGTWLRIQLPSGRYVCYAGAKVEEKKIRYLGINQYTRKWCKLSTYGGKLCISENTLVLTLRGLVAIKYITSVDIIWDGEEWVSCEGSVCKGVKKVIKAYGVYMTPKHLVLTEKGWKHASQSKRYSRTTCRLPDSYSLPSVKRPPLIMGTEMCMREKKDNECFGVYKATKQRGCSFVWVHEKKDDRSKEYNTRNDKPSGFFGLALYAQPLLFKYASSVSKLWYAGYSSVQKMARQLRSFLGRYGLYLQKRFNFRSREQRRELLQRKLSMGGPKNSSEKHTKIVKDRYPLWVNPSGGIIGKNRTWNVYNILSYVKKVYSSTVNRKTRCYAKVYDIVNCGPRNRFVVADEYGVPLIVHNCENVTQAASRDILAYGMQLAEEAGYKTVLSVHDELLTEVPDSPEFNHETLSKIMSTNPPWAPGLPLAAAGFEGYRYRKD